MSVDAETRKLAHEAAGAIRAALDQLQAAHDDLMGLTVEPKPVCGFCKGKPVGNAARWTDRNASQYAACPRCGELNLPPDDPGSHGKAD